MRAVEILEQDKAGTMNHQNSSQKSPSILNQMKLWVIVLLKIKEHILIFLVFSKKLWLLYTLPIFASYNLVTENVEKWVWKINSLLTVKQTRNR